MKATKKGGVKNGSVSMTLSWDNELTLSFNGVGNGIVEPIWETKPIIEPNEYTDPEIYGKTIVEHSSSNKWSVYDEAQTKEVWLFDVLLKNLVETIEEPERPVTRGRPRASIPELVFCAVKKVYSQLSLRRAQGLLKNSVERKYLSHAHHFNSISAFLNRNDITPILHELIELSALPLAGLETEFAVDSTGFRTTSFGEYCKKNYKTIREHKWLRAHICSGIKTNVVTAINVTNPKKHDSPEFKGLVSRTAKGFEIKEVSADKAYSSRANYEFVGDIGGQAFIPFRNNATGRAGRSALWKKAYHLFQVNREEFNKHYHKRSNVESTINAIKQKFGEILKSKNRVSQENELLCKVLAYNITVLIHEMFENGIDPDFILYRNSED